MGEGPEMDAEQNLQSRQRRRSFSLMSANGRRHSGDEEAAQADATSRLDKHLNKMQSHSHQVRLTFKQLNKWVEPPPDPNKKGFVAKAKAAVKTARGSPNLEGAVTSFADIKDVPVAVTPVQAPPLSSPMHVDKKSPAGNPKLRQILFNVSGAVFPGEVCALMGPSGSGKTTLLNILGGRALANCTGEVSLNGEPWRKSFKRVVGYVMQQDVFYVHLSVKDQLRYTALLRLPREMPYQEKMDTVDSIITILSLEKCQNTPILMVSGGEKKRVNIGTELLTDPAVLLLDEPTSGLDSTGAFSLILTIQKLARLGKTVVSSIHQPSSQVFYMFDKLLLLADGNQVYSGAPGNCTNYMAMAGYHCPSGFNPADFVMDLVSANPTRDWANAESKAGEELTSVLPKVPLMARFDKAAEYQRVLALETQTAGQYTESPQQDESRPFWGAQFNVLYKRSTMNTRSALFTPLNFTQAILLALLVGAMFNGLDTSEEKVRDRSGALFFNMTFWPFQALFSAMMSFPVERQVISKERASGSYNLSAFFMAKTISEVPVRLILPFIFMCISYFLAGLNPGAASFFGTTFTELMAVLAGESVGLFIGCTVLDLEAAIVVATVVMLTLLLAGGFFIQNIPVWISWIKYLSPFYYSYNAALKFEYDMGPHGHGVECDGSGGLSYCTDQGITATAPTSVVLDSLKQSGSIGFNLGMLAVIFVVLRVAAYYGLRYLHRDPGMGRH